ncbi:MAG: hypothetical protein U1E97_01825 [Alphaproteobacteria bacterium]
MPFMRNGFGMLGGGLALAAAVLVSGTGSLADVIVRLKDGRAVTIPFDSAQIDDVTVTPVAGGEPRTVVPAQVDNDSAISRAARQRRDAEERTRAQSDTSDESRARAQRAAEAAEEAQRAAEAARTRAEAAAAAIERMRATIERDPRGRDGAPAAERGAPPSQATPHQDTPSPSAEPSRPSPPSQAASVHRVGSGKAFRVPSDAARVARSGDTVEIDAGVYEGDVAVWPQSNLTLRGVGGMVELRSRVRPPRTRRSGC